ncbi:MULTISPECIES: Parvovirus coat protein VP1-like protein [Robertmurraya]|uniref:Parvovirus coat protein VP1-like protein n=1 Tax=Robertmurraya beringensis TaxID=641660 RepID=A0ABV6KSC6_9BACI
MPCYPGYRYCGPGCSGPGRPVNQLDALCMKHDACLRRYGSHRMCDEIFMQRMIPIRNQRNKMGRDAAIMSGFMNLKRMFSAH